MFMKVMADVLRWYEKCLKSMRNGCLSIQVIMSFAMSLVGGFHQFVSETPMLDVQNSNTLNLQSP